MRIIVGITGASGSVYGWRLLENLRSIPEIEIHLVISRSGERTAFLEMGKTAADFKALAHVSLSRWRISVAVWPVGRFQPTAW